MGADIHVYIMHLIPEKFVFLFCFSFNFFFFQNSAICNVDVLSLQDVSRMSFFFIQPIQNSLFFYFLFLLSCMDLSNDILTTFP